MKRFGGFYWKFIKNNDLLGWEKYLQQNGWMFYSQRLLMLVAQGLCDPLDAEKMIGEINQESQSGVFKYQKTTTH